MRCMKRKGKEEKTIQKRRKEGKKRNDNEIEE